jgi:hypothetical protein
MSGPIRFMILAIVIGIKNLGYLCFVRKLCSVQSIHTEFAKLYSKKVISRMVCPADLWRDGDQPDLSDQGSGIKTGSVRLY